MGRLLKLFWMVGFFVAGFFYLIWYLLNTDALGHFTPDTYYVLQNITLIFYLPSFLLMATNGSSLFTALVIGVITWLMNGLIYAGVGYVLVRLFRMISGVGVGQR
jgi:hypothetical protein